MNSYYYSNYLLRFFCPYNIYLFHNIFSTHQPPRRRKSYGSSTPKCWTPMGVSACSSLTLAIVPCSIWSWLRVVSPLAKYLTMRSSASPKHSSFRCSISPRAKIASQKLEKSSIRERFIFHSRIKPPPIALSRRPAEDSASILRCLPNEEGELWKRITGSSGIACCLSTCCGSEWSAIFGF